jgi:hypothetical protein
VCVGRYPSSDGQVKLLAVYLARLPSLGNKQIRLWQHVPITGHRNALISIQQVRLLVRTSFIAIVDSIVVFLVFVQ